MIRPVILANCLVRKNAKYLLVQEATDKIYTGISTHSRGKWTIPHGEVDESETITESAKREFLEETGGQTKVKRLGAIAFATLDGTIHLLSFIFYGDTFRKSQKRWTHEIKKAKWFSKKEIRQLEKDGKIRDKVPISKIITAIEKNKTVQFIEWKQPNYIKEIFKRLNKK